MIELVVWIFNKLVKINHMYYFLISYSSQIHIFITSFIDIFFSPLFILCLSLTSFCPFDFSCFQQCINCFPLPIIKPFQAIFPHLFINRRPPSSLSDSPHLKSYHFFIFLFFHLNIFNFDYIHFINVLLLNSPTSSIIK